MTSKITVEGRPEAADFRRLLHGLAGQMPQIVWTATASGSWTWANPSWSAYTGMRGEEATGRGWLDALHPDDRQRWCEAWAKAHEDHEAFEQTVRLRDADGAYQHFCVRSAPDSDSDSDSGLRVVMAERADDEPPLSLEDLSLEEEIRIARPILDNIFAFVAFLDLDGKVIATNRAPLEAAGLGVEDVRGRKFWDCYWWDFDPQVCQRIMDGCARAAAGEIVRFDTLLRVAGNGRMVVDLQIAPLRDATGRITHLVPSGADVTERTRAREALAESESRFRCLVEASPFPVMVHAEGGEVLTVNEAWTRLSGYASKELRSIDDWIARCYDEERGREVRAHVAGLVELKEKTAEGEFALRSSDGQIRVWDFYSGPLSVDAAGRRIVFSTAADITDRRRAEDALRESEARFRALADHMSQLAWIGDATGQVHWFNKRWYDYTGMGPEEMEDNGWRKAHHPDFVEGVVEKFRGHVEAGEVWEDTFPLRGADGSFRWFLSRASPIRDPDGRVVRWIGTNTDIDAQRQAEEALREADRRKDIFLAMLAHELRNPLAPVRNAVEVLRQIGSQSPAAQSPETDQARALIERQVTHMARLIDDLLDVSRVARGRIELRPERCDVIDIVRQTAQDYRADFEAHAKRLSLELPEAPLWVRGDPVRLAQVVGNLLHNAGKYTAPGDRVCVRLRVDAAAGQVIMEIEDTGLGIAPELLPRLFNTFSQRDQGLDRSEGGLGVGLTLARGLVELHGGTISAASPGPGLGATFTVRLPVIEAPALDEASSPRPTPSLTPSLTPSPTPSPKCEALRVVVIEDNADAAKSLEMLLSRSGYQVTLAPDGRAGLDAARQVQPEVVISDIGLPDGMDGYSVARQLRADPSLALCSPYLIALSGYGQKEDRRRSHEAGFDLHLVKPVDWPTLQDALCELRRRP